MTAREIEIGYATALALRTTYVGELGWELYLQTEFAAPVYDLLVEAGADHGLRHAGYHALNSLRIERGFRHWGHDITDEDTPLEAGLGFAVALQKPNFIGREALLRQREGPLKKRLVQFALEDPEPLLYHNEPVWRDGAIVGYIASGMYGHTLGRAIGLGYLSDEGGVSDDFVRSGSYEIEIACERFPARASLAPLYDPKGERVRM
jgi:4-methylaminobutanoate oxidase (formaldehyde-forming)